MASNRWAKALLALTVLGMAGLLPQAGGLATPDLYPGAETVEVYWMSGVIYSGRACVGVAGLHGSNAYDLIADNSGPPCYDGGVTAGVSLRTFGHSSTPHATLRANIASGTDPSSHCDYIEAHTVQKPSGEDRGTYRYLHATGSSGYYIDVWAGPTLLPTETPIGSTTNDSDCVGGWTGYHTHQDVQGSSWSQPNSLTADDDIPVWDPYYWIHRWTYPLPDTDGDWFTDAAEVYLGTDRLDACPDNAYDAAWPPDFDSDRRVGILDVLIFKPKIGKSSGEPGYDQRYDLNVDQSVSILDVLLMKPLLNHTCTN